MRRYLARFPASSIRILLADREFIRVEWLKFLNDNTIPFAIRLRDDLRVTTEDGCELTLFARLRLARRTQVFQARLGARENAEANDAPLLNSAAKRLGSEWLIVVSNAPHINAGLAVLLAILHPRAKGVGRGVRTLRTRSVPAGVPTRDEVILEGPPVAGCPSGWQADHWQTGLSPVVAHPASRLRQTTRLPHLCAEIVLANFPPAPPLARPFRFHSGSSSAGHVRWTMRRSGGGSALRR